MKRLITFLHATIVVLLFAVIYMLSPAIDITAEIDEIISKLSYQRNRVAFLEIIANESIKNCNMSVASFEHFVHVHYGLDITWRDDKYWLPDTLEVIKRDSCVDHVRMK